MGEAIVVTSGKGGVGKTTTSANVGTVLALQGKKVCLVDTDIGLRNLDVVMGLENRIIYDLVDVAQGRCKLNQALVKDKRFECLSLLPAAQTTDKDSIQPDQMKKIIDTLKADFDYIIIDCPAGIERGFKNAVAGADHAIVVTTPEISSVRDADRIIGLLEQEKQVSPPRLIINRIRQHLLKSGEMLEIDEIMNILAIDLIGIVIDDDGVISSSNKGEPIALNPSSKAAMAYRNIGRRILGETVPLMDLDEKQGFFHRVKALLGMR
ncbi:MULTISPECIES: septum site-determining protein MinD [Sporolactobacillus]|uniref:Septum site-determining protein MinD n=3 Tax=Sporolactobacillus TaxID=2077 RepID=A0A4Y3T5L4_9BACL|nr:MULTISPECIES: septum site-determining protein MinD [Sporolactobacillus]KLI03380.1 cell division inhibitor MinD [Sporolactobacillus inulinus CASD]QAA22924.1 septum site-determining protein MinD [Sporolactobacillus terrae]QAA25897.1 septum site-determining protein MinD [Sporolactobacillus terrae]UAK17772.1 septum site-determining protein MinD [Sporolactobacillus terrae]BBN99321.1 septum site-determining protein MinD [Sporolactobacillus terrae]